MSKFSDTLCKELGICDNIHALLWEYACGTLDSSYNLLIESYLEVKPTARKVVTQFETIGGSLLEKNCKPAAMDCASLNKVLAAMDCAMATAERTKTDSSATHSAAPCAKTETLPSTIRHYMSHHGVTPKWNRMVPGMAFCKLPGQDGRYTITILEAKPGVKVPEHKHNGTEIILVLSGAFKDENGTYTQGDIIINEDKSHHEPVVSGECKCTCLIVADNPMQFTGTITRLLNFLKF